MVGGHHHRLAHQVNAPCHPLDWFLLDDGDSDDGAGVDFLCGSYQFEGDIGTTLTASLPPLIIVRRGENDTVHLINELITSELAQSGAGQQTALDRLLDVLLVHLLREVFGRNYEHAPKWYLASADPAIGPPLRAMHERPGRAWTITELVALAGLSRAGFARRFADLLGQTPMRYLTAWRMSVARDQLSDPKVTMRQVAKTSVTPTPMRSPSLSNDSTASLPADGVHRSSSNQVRASPRPSTAGRERLHDGAERLPWLTSRSTVVAVHR